MPKPLPERDFQLIEAALAAAPDGLGIDEIHKRFDRDIIRRTLQYRLKFLVDDGRLVKVGSGRWTRYRLPSVSPAAAESDIDRDAESNNVLPLTPSAIEILKYVRQPLGSREPVGYEREFLDGYQPNVTVWLSKSERAHLHGVGRSKSGEQPAGTFAKQILNRLLIDLSWNSSRLEGNTYSLLDTKRLIDFGREAEGTNQLEAQMILNHKDAIEFLVGNVQDVGFNRYSILNLHALLANNLLTNPDATGRLRRIAVGIEKSVFHPLEVPQLIEECFAHLLSKAEAIEDPFEQALFTMVHLPYLQPFDDVNKRVSRLTANIPFIKANLTPLSFTDVSTEDYTAAILGVYELRRVELLKDIFIWAYERSSSRYTAIRQSLGDPDPFRIKHRLALRELVQLVVIERLDRSSAFGRIENWVSQHIETGDRERFREVAEDELLALHEGNFARYRIRPAQFHDWQDVWTRPTT